MIVPVVITGLVLFPVLLWIIFPSEDLVPHSIDIHVLPERKFSSDSTESEKIGCDPAAPHNAGVHTGANGDIEAGKEAEDEIDPSIDLRAILHPVLDRPAAIFCLVLFIITLAVLLATNAAGLGVQVYAITVPAAFVMLCRDAIDDWFFRPKKNVQVDTEGKIINQGVEDLVGEEEKGRRLSTDYENEKGSSTAGGTLRHNTNASTSTAVSSPTLHGDMSEGDPALSSSLVLEHCDEPGYMGPHSREGEREPTMSSSEGNIANMNIPAITIQNASSIALSHKNDTHSFHSSIPRPSASLSPSPSRTLSSGTPSDSKTPPSPSPSSSSLPPRPHSLVSAFSTLSHRASCAFPRSYSVLSQLPYPLLPFTFGMFILVQGLVTKGWVQIFANGWEGWVNVGGTTGAVFGMGLVSVLLCNVSPFLTSRFGFLVVTWAGAGGLN